MRIAIVTPYADPEKGAAVVRVNSFRDFFREKGHHFSVLAPSRGDVYSSDVTRYRNKRELLRQISHIRPDVVIGTSTSMSDVLAARMYCRLKRLRFVFDSKEPFLHSVTQLGLLREHSAKYRLFAFAEKFLYRNSDFVFMLTEHDKEYVITQYAINRQKIAVISNGSNTRDMFNDRKAGLETRRALGIPQRGRVAVYCGGVGDEDVDIFLERAAGAIKKHNIHIIMVLALSGKNEAYERLIGAVRREGLEERVHIIFNKRYQDMYRYLSAADVSVLPWPEKLVFSLPVKVFDSLAAEIPVVAKGPEKGPLKNFFERYDIGYYATNWTCFMKNFEKALKSDRERTKKGLTGRHVIETLFSRDIFNAKALGILEGLVV